MRQDRRKPMSRGERRLRNATTAEEIRQLARQQRKGLPKCYAPPEMAAWER